MSAPSQFALDRLRGTAAPPQANGEPVFANPTQARLFGMAHALATAGVFDWDGFRDALIAALARDEAAGAPFDYYRSFESALETLVLAAGAVAREDIDARAAAVLAAGDGHGDHDHDHDHAHDRDHAHDHDHAHGRAQHASASHDAAARPVGDD